MPNRLSSIPSKRWTPLQAFGVVLFLSVLTACAYHQVIGNSFVQYDDQNYVSGNPIVLKGLTSESVAWAFSALHASNWHPLTWLSHMLDVEMFGTDPSGHHAVNLLFHVLNSVLLFAVLCQATGEPWKSVFVAALFAVHPLHVESVAWVAERKDVLSTFFWMLTMWAYSRYAVRPRTSVYLLALLFFALGLLAKPMLVTLPFVLLLMDYWPLGRMARPVLPEAAGRSGDTSIGLRRILLEKVPFLLLSAGSCVMTLLAQSRARNVASMLFPLGARVSNAVVAYARYIGKTLYPSSLAIFYPHPLHTLPAWEVAGALLLLAAASWVAVRYRGRMPFLAVGWFWYLGTLVPVIGIVQVGEQAVADRYTYVPLIGIFLMLSWGAGELARRFRIPWQAVAASGGALVLLLAALTWNQVRHWKDSVSLFRHAVEVTENNPRMMHALGIALESRGREQLLKDRAVDAIGDLQEANRYKPYDPLILLELGIALVKAGKAGEAVPYLQRVTEIRPDWEPARQFLRMAQDQVGGMPGPNSGQIRDRVNGTRK
jgi:tetratricopeptide (TPR) repeat protein